MDHDLKQLRKMGHPYALKSTKEIHDPPHQVHIQSGDLQNAIKMEVLDDGRRIRVGVDDSEAPHAAAVILGTSRMVSRDFVRGSYEEVLPELKEIARTGE